MLSFVSVSCLDKMQVRKYPQSNQLFAYIKFAIALLTGFQPFSQLKT